MDYKTKTKENLYVNLQEPIISSHLDAPDLENSRHSSILNPDALNQKNTGSVSSKSSESFPIFIKFMDNSQKEFDISELLASKAIELHKLAFPQNFADETKSIRLIFRGRLIKPEETIQSLNIQKGAYLHAVMNDRIARVETSENKVETSLPAVENGPEPQLSVAQQEAFQIMNLIIEAQGRARANIGQNNNNNNPQDNRIGPNTLFIMGTIFGYFFNIWAVLLMFICNFPEKARNGVMFGFCLHLIIRLFNLMNN